MSDTYHELLVKRRPRTFDKLCKVALILTTILAGAAILLTFWAALVFLALCIFDYFKLPSFNVEFEYIYVNGELDVDKVMSQKSRKHAASYDIAGKMELIAPWDSREMDYYKNGYRGKVADYTSGEEGAKIYAMVYGTEKAPQIVLLEPDEEMLREFQRIQPRKVHI